MATEVPPQWPWAKNHLGPPVDPATAWTVHEGKLYLNFGRGIRSQWMENMEANIAAATKRWSGWFNATSEPFNTHCYPFSDCKCGAAAAMLACFTSR